MPLFLLLLLLTCYLNGSISKTHFCHYRHYRGLCNFLSCLSVLLFSSLITYSKAWDATAFVHFLSKFFHASKVQCTCVNRSRGAGSFCWPSPSVLFCSSWLELCFFFILDFDQGFIFKPYFKTVLIGTLYLIDSDFYLS